MINGVNNNEDIKIVVIGVGGGGGNAVNNMIASAEGTQIKFVVVNTDGQDIEKSTAENRILITTKNKTNAGLGAGAKPEVGADAAENCLDTIAKELEGANLCFISAGLGGGTGTGAAPVIANFAKREKDITTVAVVTKPFSWEGKKRAVNAEAGLARLKEATDSLIVIPNDRVVDMSSKKTSLVEAFKAADNVLRDGVLGITDLITKTGLINLDFADVQSIVKDAGESHMGIGTYTASGDDENPVLIALNKAIDSPLLETSIDGAKRIMINYASSEELSMLDIAEANQMVYDKADDDVNLIWGAATDSSLPEGEVKVTVIAADFNSVAQGSVGGNQTMQSNQMNTQSSGIGSMVGNVDATPHYGYTGMQTPNTNYNANTGLGTNSGLGSNAGLGNSGLGNAGYSNVGYGIGNSMHQSTPQPQVVESASIPTSTTSAPKTFDANKFKQLFSRKN